MPKGFVQTRIIQPDPVDPALSAKAGGLRYVTDSMAGIRRVKRRQGWAYIGSDGKKVVDSAVLGRIKSLAIPPAWTDVWICPLEHGHLQATGRDARGRKQHRYHPRWREVRDETKYNRMIEFAQVLPRIRRRIKADLGVRGLPRKKVLATVARLLEVSLIRVGNDEYARNNRSFGLTTMQDRHVDVEGSKILFHFRGKSGKDHAVDLTDRQLARIVGSCQDLPGQELFQYIDQQGKRCDVTSTDVNEYLREITKSDFTAKDFRTWAGTVMAVLALRELEQFDSKAQAKKNLVRAVEAVAQRLGNTPSVCRKCYIPPPRYLWANPAYDVVHASIVPCHGNLLEALRENRPAETSGEDNLQTVRLVFASYESAKTGQPIDLLAWSPSSVETQRGSEGQM